MSLFDYASPLLGGWHQPLCSKDLSMPTGTWKPRSEATVSQPSSTVLRQIEFTLKLQEDIQDGT